MTGIDLKGMYQEKAEDLADEKYGDETDFYELSEEIQLQLYSEAITLVDDGLIAQADSMRDELALWGVDNV